MTPPAAAPGRVARLGSNEQGLIAAAPLLPGVTVARFAGPIVSWREVPPAEVRHALLLQGDEWMLPTTDARFANHSCAPNCTVDDDLGIVTRRAVAAGEELTISYDTLTLAEYVRAPAAYFWDERWTFDCRCGAPGCVGRVDRYRIRNYETPGLVTPGTKLRLYPSAGRGRGVWATAPIAAGEIFERAPVIVSPAGEWGHVEQTVLNHYCFSWGPNLEHAAIGLGYASLYNHSYEPNAVYVRQLDDLLIHFVARRAIAAGEEITVNYNNDPTDRQPVWFDVK